MVLQTNCNDDSPYLIADAIKHSRDRRRSRIKGFYVCKDCSNQFIANVPRKEINCPICGKKLSIVSTVDEFEINRIKSYAGETLLIEGESMYLNKIKIFKKCYAKRRKESY